MVCPSFVLQIGLSGQKSQRAILRMRGITQLSGDPACAFLRADLQDNEMAVRCSIVLDGFAPIFV
jgi:hypothetical protein